ncbi:hypothetical protein [Olivibacter sitiensis]|uniref:hypothetical protein n=1 Tax=Olivibacter sitiensis TaxID=376470 RepID=UPI000485B257|nr:hypothetical protein [Olivibacter sitiensis]
MAKMDFDNGIKPLHVPATFDRDADIEEQAVYALAYLGRATAPQVAAKLAELNSKEDVEELEVIVAKLLNKLYDQGFINGVDTGKGMQYNLDKEVVAHTGKVDPKDIH